MVFIIIRLIIFALIGFALYQFFAYFLRSDKELNCPRCLGKGSWDGVRSKEKCNRCNGTGKLLKSPIQK